MNFHLHLVLAALISVCFCLKGFACACNEVKPVSNPPQNGTQTILDGLKFTLTPTYKKEFSEAIKQARLSLTKYIGTPNVAIVADIDETVLDNRPHMKAKPVMGWQYFEPWVNEAKAPALKPTADLVNWARKNGFAVFLITGRLEKTRRATIENLVRAGITYDGLFMRPDGNHAPAEQFKSNYRKTINDMGFKVVLNIGDQVSDLLGGYSEDCVKLPNHMYFIN